MDGVNIEYDLTKMAVLEEEALKLL